MNKKILAVILTVCMAATATVGFTGCGKKDKDESSSKITSMKEIRKDLFKDIDKCVDLGEYKNISVSVEEKKVTDEDVQKAIDEDLVSYGTVTQIKEGTVADGDTINIDYTGKIDGTEFDGGSSTDYDLTIGSNSFIEGFETQLVGANIGETKDITVTFPSDYSNTDLAGKEAVFTVVLNYKHGDTVPAELTDDLVVSMSLKDADGKEVKTVDAYKSYKKASLEDSAKSDQDDAEYQAILDQLLKNCKVKKLHDDLNKEDLKNEELDYMKQYASYYGYEYDEFVALYTGKSAEEYEKELDKQIEDYVNRIMIYRAIAEKEDITIKQKDYEDQVNSYSKNYENYGSESEDDFKKEYSSKIYEFALYDEVESFLKKSAKVDLCSPSPATDAPTATPAA